MRDLFQDQLLPGLATATELVTPSEESELIARIGAVALAPFRFQGWTGKRLTHSFGWSYDFDRGRLDAGDPLPDWLLHLRERAATLARMPAEELVQALLSRYDRGAGIGWHRDRPAFEHVIGLSLGAPSTMRLRRRRPGGGFDRASFPLEPRAADHLTDEARHEWEHSIAPVLQPRWSITFRSLASRQ